MLPTGTGVQMNPEILLITAAMLGLGALVAKWLSARTSRGSKDLALSLGLFSGTGVFMAMGSIEMAGRYGFSIILALVGFSLVFVLSPLILAPIRRLNEIIRFATPVDFLTFRFRNKSVAMITCVSLIVATLPLILAQITAIQAVASYLLNDDYQLLVLLLISAALVAINLRSIQVGASNHLGWIMTAAGLLLLPALGFSAWTSIETIFGSLGEMNNWVADSGQLKIVKRMDLSYSIFTIFLITSFASPINFSLLVSDNISERQTGMTSWAYPLLVLLACIPVFPLLWAGISVQSFSPLQEYLYNLPALTSHPSVAGLGTASIMLLGLSFSCSLILIWSKILMNSFLLPSKKLYLQPRLSAWLKQRQGLIAVCLIVFCAALSLLVKSRSITDYYLAGFSGLAQLTPGMLAAIYLPNVNRRGFIGGLVAGISLWLITIALPLLFGDWSWQLPISDTTIQFGMQNWNIWAIEALLVNITVCIIFSVFGPMDAEQKSFAAVCMIDNVYIPARVEITQKSVAEITSSLRLSLGEAADSEVAKALDNLGFDQAEVRPSALRQLRDNINASLNMRFGVLTANRIMEKSLPVTIPAANEPDDIYLIESALAIHGDRLTGIASELNKLRMHHREIIDNLPIGVISVDQSGEIIKWNTTLADYTGWDSKTVTGSSINDLPEPWGSAISSFIASDSTVLDELRLEFGDQVRWFGLQKSAQHINPDPDTDIVVLIEDNTKAINLIQKAIDNERLASVGRLAAGVAHEIGNPVTGIACLAQNLQHETETGQIAESAEQILSQTQRINRIVQSLISFSKGGSALSKSRQKIELQRAAEEAIRLLTMSPSPIAVNFRSIIDPELTIDGDYNQLLQIFLNLLSNARDASPQGGVISITADSTDKHVHLKVSDQGTGIEDSLQSHLFEPFVTSKDPGSGTGLGLWVVFNLVKSLGAEISISSPAENSQCGTTATISFPLSSAV